MRDMAAASASSVVFQPGESRSGEFRRGWPVVLAAMLGIGLGLSPLGFYTVGIFAPILASTFGWSFGQIFAGITVQTVAVALLAPFCGALSTRYGARPVALVSVALFAVSFMAFALSNGSLVFFYALWATQGVLGLGTLPMTWTRGINQRFNVHKGLALGIAMMGTGLFGVVCKPMTAWFIATWGWRGAYAAIGALPLLIALPVGYAFFRELPIGKVPGGAVPGGAATGGAATGGAATGGEVPAASGLSTPQAVRHWRFWLLAAVLVPISFAIGGPIPNLENILHLKGFEHGEIVGLTSLIGLSAIAGRLLGGWLLDLFWAPAVAVAILALPCVSCWLLSLGQISSTEAAVAICLIGFSVGVEYDLLAYLTARYFGLHSYATIYAMLYVCFAIGAGFGPMLFGWAFELSGSYTPVLRAALVLLVCGALCLLALGRYPRFAGDDLARSG